MESYDLHSESDSEFIGRRKGRKLLAEKRRRARINQCLKQIKHIVCGAEMQKDPNFEKMEKAEILETTVDYLRNVRKINTARQQVHETVQVRFQQGFSRCAEEILTYIQTLPGVSDGVHHHLRKHLSDRLTHIQHAPVTSSAQTLSPYPRYYNERLPVTTCFPANGASAHEYPKTFVCTSPTQNELSYPDSGVECSPDSSKYPSFRVKQQPQSDTRSDSELYNVDSKLSVNSYKDSRVTAWVESTLSYSQQIKMEQRAPWRPW